MTGLNYTMVYSTCLLFLVSVRQYKANKSSNYHSGDLPQQCGNGFAWIVIDLDDETRIWSESASVRNSHLFTLPVALFSNMMC